VSRNTHLPKVSMDLVIEEVITSALFYCAQVDAIELFQASSASMLCSNFNLSIQADTKLTVTSILFVRLFVNCKIIQLLKVVCLQCVFYSSVLNLNLNLCKLLWISIVRHHPSVI
jgi:hypothetical protein